MSAPSPDPPNTRRNADSRQEIVNSGGLGSSGAGCRSFRKHNRLNLRLAHPTARKRPSTPSPPPRNTSIKSAGRQAAPTQINSRCPKPPHIHPKSASSPTFADLKLHKQKLQPRPSDQHQNPLFSMITYTKGPQECTRYFWSHARARRFLTWWSSFLLFGDGVVPCITPWPSHVQARTPSAMRSSWRRTHSDTGACLCGCC